jgi:hypothetical protein
MDKYMNHLLGGMVLVMFALGGWVMTINADVAVLRSNDARYEKIIEKNTEALVDLKVVFAEFFAEMKARR